MKDIAVDHMRSDNGRWIPEGYWGIILIIPATVMVGGLIIYPVSGCADGRKGDGLLLSPPLTITSEEIDLLLELLRETVAEISKEII